MMFIQRKALYNLLQLNLSRIQSGELQIGDIKPWQIENYRVQTQEELFDQLKQLGVIVDLASYANHFDSPEELCEALAKDRSPLEQDQIFLILFELWRRLYPEKRTVSIFCDDLDQLMIHYDMGKLESTSELQDGMVYLQNMLDENVDKGVKPKEAFQVIQTYFATDVESFLFDYILEEIDLGHRDYASELLEGFYRYVFDPIWFDYLKARLQILEDPEAGYSLLESVIRKINDETNLDLVEEILSFLATSGNHSLFYTSAIKILTFLKQEEDFKEFLEICYSHYDYLELKQPSLDVARIFYNREEIDPEQALSSDDLDLKVIREILDQKLVL